MILPLLLFAVCLPQDTPSEKIRAVHADHGVRADAEKVEKNLASVRGVRIKTASAPGLVEELRAAGLASVDLAMTRLAGVEPTMSEILVMTERFWGTGAKPQEGPKRLDLRGFENLCEHVFRDLHKALGSGRNLDKEAPRLHTAVEQLRKEIRNFDDVGRERAAQIAAALERAEGVDHREILRLAGTVVMGAFALNDPAQIDRLKRQPTRKARTSPGGVTGEVLRDRDTGFGRIVIGGFGRNTYDCSQIDVIIDLGGADVYSGPAGGVDGLRKMAVVVDLSGDDEYTALNDGLGAATYGLGVLIDMAGDDHYRAGKRSGGFGAAGVGVFLDVSGDDEVHFGDQSGGVGLIGTGLFADLAGNDVQHAGVQAFGCGLPGGVGVCVDVRGADFRKLARQEKDLSNQGGEAISVGLGAGVGMRPLLGAGLGVHLDYDGDDRYEAGGLVLGAGLHGGAGLFRDRGGDDVYRAGVSSLGAAYGHSIAVFLDDDGKDDYQAAQHSIGSATAAGIAWFVDRAGDDRYAALAPSMGQAGRASLACLLDCSGTDRYRKVGSSWQLRELGAHEQTAIGVFLDEGGTEDVFTFTMAEAPRNGDARVVESGEGEHDVLILVSR